MARRRGRVERFRAWLAEASTLKSVNGWLAVLWLAAGIIGLWFGAQNSVPVLYFLSVYAIVAGHWSAWQAGRTEVLQVDVEEARSS